MGLQYPASSNSFQIPSEGYPNLVPRPLSYSSHRAGTSKGWFPLTRFCLRTLSTENLSHVDKIEAIYKMLRVNVKLSEVLLLRLRATFHALPLFYLFSNVNLRTYARKKYETVEINPKANKIFFLGKRHAARYQNWLTKNSLRAPLVAHS